MRKTKEMSYANFEIIRPLYGMKKKISSTSLRTGDRFIHNGFHGLFFKTNAAPIEGKYLCCDEGGSIEWIDGKAEVTRINGIAFDLQSYVSKFKNHYLSNKW